MSEPMVQSRMLGASRPGPRWRRHPAEALRLARIASAIEDEADRYPAESAIRADLDAASAAVRHAGDLAVSPD